MKTYDSISINSAIKLLEKNLVLLFARIEKLKLRLAELYRFKNKLATRDNFNNELRESKMNSQDVIVKYCWKCNKMSEFEESELNYVIKKTGGTKYCCKACNKAWKAYTGVDKVVRVDTPDSLFSCRFEYIYKDKNE